MRDSDARAITRLCSEAGEIQSPGLALDHFLAGTAQLLNADVTSLFAAHVDQQGYRAGAGVVRGLDASQMGLIQKWYFDGGERIRDPFNQALLHSGHPSTTKVRRSLIGDEEWYRNPHVCEQARLIGVDDVLVAVRPLGDDSIIFSQHRSSGSRPFSPDDEERLGLLCDLSRWFFEALRQAGLVVPVRRHADLPLRLEKVLDQLLRGYSEKDIAVRLGYTPATVHKYVEQLYRILNVSSRPELMARWIPPRETKFHPVGGTVISSRRPYR